MQYIYDILIFEDGIKYRGLNTIFREGAQKRTLFLRNGKSTLYSVTCDIRLSTQFSLILYRQDRTDMVNTLAAEYKMKQEE